MEDQEQEENKMDVITVDVPLFIRLLEFAREDATDDMKLHDVAEKLIEMCADGDIMTMEQYDEIVGSQENGADTSGMNAVEDNMHDQNKDMNTINEQRWLKLAGINENQVKQLNEEEESEIIPGGRDKDFAIRGVKGSVPPNAYQIVAWVSRGRLTAQQAMVLFEKYGFTTWDFIRAGWEIGKSSIPLKNIPF